MGGMHSIESEPIQEQVVRLAHAVETMGVQLHSIEQNQIRLEAMFHRLWSQLAPGLDFEEDVLERAA
ncbi:MAG: hypothetical protein IT210_10645 [Armatimonadetes bacterium]|nr:hypothetical protein [Armatimonadota bacterium]